MWCVISKSELRMAPRKRMKGQSSSTVEPEQEYDKTKFVSFGA